MNPEKTAAKTSSIARRIFRKHLVLIVLAVLHFDETKITPDGKAALNVLLPNCKIVIPGQ